MSTYTCPEGHSSGDPDYCDTCGSPIGRAAASPPGSSPAASSSPASSSAASSQAPSSQDQPPSGGGSLGGSFFDLDAPAAPSAPAVQVCPNCSAEAAADALFCENCGYDFTTGQLPQPLEPPLGQDQAGAMIVDHAGSSDPGAIVQPAPPAAASSGPDFGGPDSSGSHSSGPDSSGSDSKRSGSPSAGAASSAASTSGSPERGLGAQDQQNVVEVWVDPDWHAAQDVDDPCPSPGMPTVVPLASRSVLVGRTSASRNITPDVEVVGDTGVSRRHAQLTTDGRRWFVEDLGSANGTYIGAPGGPLPTDPIAAGARVELPDDGRVYIGAWTRLVVRKALPGEV